ncbi:CLUMA_CG007501, isoform A [Clunio marinus]|uniref:CLUMA_CG007501, isoform A n=1 Tax=Clunio marinus TaxID=568069 RepID=A0A1J1I0U7_9DIPT|nr:CLUMA_CG007501, isoform A [Clunio marinus]
MVVSCIDIIRRFVQIMNSNIEKTLKIANNNNDKLRSEIDMVIQIYEDITDVIRLFQQNYGPLILILQCYCMFVTINQLFYLYGFGLSFKNGSILFKLMLIVFAMLHSLQLLLIAKAAKYLQHEGNRTKHLWYRFNFLPQNLPVAIEKSVEEMKLHMVLNPIAIELCGMFTLNYFILYAVIATGAEYLVMLIQFDIGSSKFAKGLN